MWGIVLAAAGAAILMTKPSLAHLHVPERGKKYLDAFARWASSSSIPADILLAWVNNESSFVPTTYNPEPSVMASWSSAIVNDVRWKVNPDYAKARAVYDALLSGKTGQQIAGEDSGKPFDERQWTFGSAGLFQVSRNTASGSGGVSRNVPNSKMFEIETNFKAGTNVINAFKKQMGFTSAALTDQEWAKVRAGYVMGPRGPAKNPLKAKQIGDKFLAALTEIRSGALVS